MVYVCQEAPTLVCQQSMANNIATPSIATQQLPHNNCHTTIATPSIATPSIVTQLIATQQLPHNQLPQIRDRFEFPLELDMWPYTAEGIAAMEDDPGARPVAPLSFRYRLHGVVVHSGTAFAGHYYSYIRARDGEQQGGRWWCFDDGNVAAWDVSRLEADCFGGTVACEVVDSNSSTVMQV